MRLPLNYILSVFVFEGHGSTIRQGALGSNKTGELTIDGTVFTRCTAKFVHVFVVFCTLEFRKVHLHFTNVTKLIQF